MEENLLQLNESLIISKNHEKVEIKEINEVDGFLMITFNNYDRIVTNGLIYYNASEYEKLQSIIMINNVPHAVFFFNLSNAAVVNIITKEVIFSDKFVYYIVKGTDNLLKIIMQGNEKTRVFDISKKEYIPIYKEHENFVLQSIEDNGFIVLKDKDDLKYKSIYDCPKALLDNEGKTILNDIKGEIYVVDGYVFVTEKTSLTVININSLDNEIVKIEQKEDVIAKPSFLTAPQIIVVIFKDRIKIFDYDFNVLNDIPFEGLKAYIDSEIVNNILKISLKTEKAFRHIFLNVKTGTKIEHDMIEGFDYWDPTVYVGKNYGDGITYQNYPDMKTESTFFIYDANLRLRTSFKGLFCDSVFDNNYDLYYLDVLEDGIQKKKVYSFKQNKVKDLNTDEIFKISSSTYVYTISKERIITFYDEDFDPIISFSLEEYNLKFSSSNFSYFICNGYLGMQIYYTGDWGNSIYRYILRNPKGETLLDSTSSCCKLIGNIIEISDNVELETKYLNTQNGTIGKLEILMPTKDKKIDLEKLSHIGLNLAIEEKNPTRERKKHD